MKVRVIYRSNESIFATKSIKKIGEFRFMRTAKGTSLQNNQKAFGKETCIIIYKTEVQGFI